MQVSLTATGGLERRLEVAVPAERVAREIEQRLKQISRTARLKGFRPGKAPLSVVRQQFGGQVRTEVIGELMRTTFAEAVTKENLKPATGPRIEPIAMDPGSDLRYAAIFEVLPEIRLRPLDGVTIERPVASVTEEDVDAMVESMRRQRPEFVEVQRPAQANDRVTIDYEGRVDGQPVEGASGTDVSFIVGGGRVMPELDQAVQGAAAGETCTAEVQYPAEHPTPSLAGKRVQFNLTVKKVEEQRLPEVNEEFCRAFGVESGSVEELRAEVRQSMERELAELVRNRLRSQVMDALYRENTIEVPRALVEEQIRELQIDFARRTGARDLSQLPPRETFEEPARRRVALGLIISEIVRSEGIKVDRAKLDARIDEIASAYPNSDEVRRAYLQSPEAIRGIESAVLEDQVVDWVLERVKINDKPMSFKEVTGFGQNSESQT